MNLKDFGFIRVAAGYGKIEVGNCEHNVDEIIKLIDKNESWNVDLFVFPELCITGYTCGDLFNQSSLLNNAESEIVRLIDSVDSDLFVAVGCPVRVGNSLYNCAIIINDGRIVGIIPKQHLPNYKEFYEARWFKAADGSEPKTVKFAGREVPFGKNMLFKGVNHNDVVIGVEICEDIWMPVPPSSIQAVAGATILINLSASNETVAKSDYRRSLVENQSGRCIAAYVYSSCGDSESTTDVVFSGHCLIAENGSVLAETKRFQDTEIIIQDIDVEKLANERRRTTSFNTNKNNLADVSNLVINEITLPEYHVKESDGWFVRKISKNPFVPTDVKTLEERCQEIINIQTAGLKKRLRHNPVIGVSGGLDSTLALLIAAKACDKLGWSRDEIQAYTMPGFGTSEGTKNNAIKLMELLGVTQHNVDICGLSFQMFTDMKHKPFGIKLDHSGPRADNIECLKANLRNIPAGSQDVVFENVQARARTYLLMSNGFVIGTGDMSELALGWATYNGDHMSMYNPNCSIPKTLVKFLVKYMADQNWFGEEVSKVLIDIVNTEISPELLPLDKDGKIAQSTQDIIGPYELHDFFLFNLVRNGFSPDKIEFLANMAFNNTYDVKTIRKWLTVFITRFFANQFKRSCVPDGPKVGSVSLSPRGDWRMPSDACATEWLERVSNER